MYGWAPVTTAGDLKTFPAEKVVTKGMGIDGSIELHAKCGHFAGDRRPGHTFLMIPHFSMIYLNSPLLLMSPGSLSGNVNTPFSIESRSSKVS